MITKLNVLISLVLAMFAGIWGMGRTKKKEGRAEAEARYEREANEDLRKAFEARERVYTDPANSPSGGGLHDDDGFRRN